MPLEQLTERNTADRSQQVVGLLSELSDRLRKSETERDLIRRELLTVRECIQDLNDRNDQMQKMHLAFENKFDATENTVDGALRRLTNMEESVDKQSTELLAILRKIEERFDVYDRDYKNHVASITHYGDTLDRFDKKLEKLMADKGRLARKLDALEFQLADTEDRIAETGAPPRPRRTLPVFNTDIDSDDEPAPAPKAWDEQTGTVTVPTAANDIMTTQEQQYRRAARWAIITRVARVGAVAVMMFLVGAVVYGLTTAVVNHPDTKKLMAQAETTLTTTVNAWLKPILERPPTVTKPPTPAAQVATLPAPPIIAPAPETAPTSIVTTATPTTTTDTTISAAPAPLLPDKDFFSPAIRAQIDAQAVTARKAEDDDTARLMLEGQQSTPLTQRLVRDKALPRAIQAIEDKAASGSADAQHDMGALYTAGRSNVPVDYTRSAFWFREAAQNGVANARYNLGVLYQQGLGVNKDMPSALAWYRSAALLEHPEARYNLGISYIEGIGVPYNPAMAAGYFEQSARSGVVEAAYNLGLIYENGLIDGPRPLEALFWYKLAMDSGSTQGRTNFDRLRAAQNITPDAWENVFPRMVDERPDLRQLANSRATRTISLNTAAPTVRIHTPPSPETKSEPSRPTITTAPPRLRTQSLR
jgi:predicted  nucleic acid-binding Zn-ribbon protein